MSFFAVLALILAVLSIISYIFLRLTQPWAQGWPLPLGLLFFYANTLAARLLPASCPDFILRFSAFVGGLWIAVLYYTALAAIVQLTLYIVARLGHWSLPWRQLAAFFLISVAIFVAWGTWRAFTPVLRSETIATGKLAPETSYKIAVVSDLHLGKINGYNYSKRLVERLNALEPDLVCIAGDILDDRQEFIDKENSLKPLEELKAPLGVYVCFGNHDYLDRPSLWQDRLKALGFIVLRNRSVIVDYRLKLTGLEDFRVEPDNVALNALAKDNAPYYSILLDHQPRRFEAARLAGYDLYLAGHTHTGQLWPNRFFTRRLYALDYGRAEFGNMTAVTSNGYGFWGPPVRTEVAPEYILITLEGRGTKN